GSGADQDLGRRTELDAHAFHSRGNLLVVADIAAQAQARATSMLDFQMAQVQFGFATCEKTYAGTSRGESNGQPFSDPASRAGDQNRHGLERMHHHQGNTNAAGMLSLIGRASDGNLPPPASSPHGTSRASASARACRPPPPGSSGTPPLRPRLY